MISVDAVRALASRRPSVVLAFLAASAVTAVGAVGAAGCGSSSSGGSGGGETVAPGPTVAQPSCNTDGGDWPMFGQNICNTASQEIAGGISKDSVGKLAVAWTYKAAGADVSATPAVVGGSVYFPDWSGKINRLDAATGAVKWSKDVAALLTSAGYPGSLGGWVSRGTPLVTNGLVIFGTVRDPPNVILQPGAGSYLVALDQDTAAIKWVSLLDYRTSRRVVSGSPVLDSTTGTLYVGVSSQEEYGGLASAFGVPYTCCSFRGSAVAVDVTTGMIKWKTSTITDDLFYFGSDVGAPVLRGRFVDCGQAERRPARTRRLRHPRASRADRDLEQHAGHRPEAQPAHRDDRRQLQDDQSERGGHRAGQLGRSRSSRSTSAPE